MATNLRLHRRTEDALRAEAARTGRSQQDLIRDAVDVALGLQTESPSPDLDGQRARELCRRGIRPQRSNFTEATVLIQPPDGVTSADLLDRDDRLR